MSNAGRKVFYKATVVKLANILLDQTNFPKKPLRKSHLSSAYFTKLVGLTNPLTLASSRFWGIWAICFNRVNVLKLSL